MANENIDLSTVKSMTLGGGDVWSIADSDGTELWKKTPVGYPLKVSTYGKYTTSTPQLYL